MHAHLRTAGFASFEGGVETISEYGRRAIDIQRSLLDGATCGEEELVDYVLLGVPSSYHTVRTIVGDSKESNLKDVLRRLARHQEQELKQGSDTPGSGVALSSQARRHPTQTTHHHQKQQKQRDHKRMRCYNCNKGHIAVSCSFPPMKNKDGDGSHASHGRALIATALATSAHESATNWVVDTGAKHQIITSDPSCVTNIQQVERLLRPLCLAEEILCHRSG
jgi:hypothetical protein